MTWSPWRAFPDPRRGDCLIAPIGPGCYQLRRGDDGEPVLFGVGRSVAFRMISLLPKPHGAGARNNKEKQEYVWEHLACLEYSTLACLDIAAARNEERRLKASRRFLFAT